MTSESLKTQLDWIFGFYDIDQDDHISHSDMLSYLKALYNLKYVDSSNEKNDHLARKHISFIFEVGSTVETSPVSESSHKC